MGASAVPGKPSDRPLACRAQRGLPLLRGSTRHAAPCKGQLPPAALLLDTPPLGGTTEHTCGSPPCHPGPGRTVGREVFSIPPSAQEGGALSGSQARGFEPRGSFLLML